MCGIAGVVRFDGDASDLEVERQLRTLDHRGPDSWGVHRDGCAAIGQNRLRIIDLVTGDPPIATPDGSIGVAFNGEIYNYAALREELLAEGHHLRTQGDTEVIAHLSERSEAADVATRLDGMFAYGVWDARRRRLVLARDRFGKKPLYYWQGPRSVVFGSEIKAVLAHPDVSADLDVDVIPAYLRFGYVPTPRTFFTGIRSVPPASVLIVEPDARSVRIEPYWSLPAPGTLTSVSFDEAAALVREKLAASVRKRLVADVPLGAFLSGGVDSAAVVALMAEASSAPVRTFTIGFRDPAFDERATAARVAAHVGAEHTELVVEPQAIELIERLVHHFDQPFGDSSAIPMWYLAELTSAHVTVALSGDGGDELFAGYERFRAGMVAARLGPLAPAVSVVTRRLPARGRLAALRRFGARLHRPLPDAYLDWVGYTPADDAGALAGADGFGLAHHQAVWEAASGGDTLDRLLRLNAATYLLDDLLPKADRTSMAHALEVRAPMLDVDLAMLTFTLPSSYKATSRGRKVVLRAAVRDLVPDEVLHLPKKGFGVPLDRWFREDLATYVDHMLGPAASTRRHLRGDVLDRILAEHRRGRVDRGHVIWALLTLEVFLRARGW